MKLKLILALVGLSLYVVAGLTIWGLKNRVDVLELKVESVEKERDHAKEQYAQCLADQQLTEEVSNGYQTKLTALNRQLSDLKRLRDKPACVPTTSAASERDGTTGRGEYARSDGIRTIWLYDFAGEAEQYRLQLISCQEFINRTWERSNGRTEATGN